MTNTQLKTLFTKKMLCVIKITLTFLFVAFLFVSITTTTSKIKNTKIYSPRANYRGDWSHRFSDKNGTVRTGSSQIRVLILGSMRTGSSFTGSLLSGSEDMTYVYEPGLAARGLVKKTIDSRLPTNIYVNILPRLFRCDFRKLDYLLHRFLINQSEKMALQMADDCSKTGNRTACNNAREAATKICRKRKYIGVKMVRVPDLNLVMPMIEDEAVKLRVIDLVRDPRAMLASFAVWQHWRRRFPNHQLLTKLDSTMIAYLSYYCKYRWQNFEMGRRSPSLQQGQYMFTRYEDEAMNPMAAAERIHRFIGRTDGVPDSIVQWINQNIVVVKKGKLKRQSNETYRAWRKVLSFDVVKQIQSLDYCPRMMVAMGYEMVQDEAHLRDLSRPLVGDIPEEYNKKYDFLWG